MKSDTHLSSLRLTTQRTNTTILWNSLQMVHISLQGFPVIAIFSGYPHKRVPRRSRLKASNLMIVLVTREQDLRGMPHSVALLFLQPRHV